MKSSAGHLQPTLGEITGEIFSTEFSLALSLNLHETPGGPAIGPGDSVGIEVGTYVYASVTGAYFSEFGLRAYATDCWVTPSIDPYERLRWDLLTDR